MKITFPLIFQLICLCLKGQTSFEEKVVIPLRENSIPQERIFVHTNKTSYFTNDIVWFKVYIGDSDNAPSLPSTKLYINLLSPSGELITSKDIFIFKGTGLGQFELNNKVRPGKYYIQAYTNHSRNFADDFIYLQEILVLGNEDKKRRVEQLLYDIQILPEGGYLLENAENVIGIKSMINGNGFDISGKIVDSKNEVVANFADQHLGMTRCSFFYKTGEQYSAIVNINDTLINVRVPTARSKGILLGVKSLKDSLIFALKTNRASLDQETGFQHTLLYHQRNKIIGFVEMKRMDSMEARIVLSKNILPEGVNTVTLFKGDQPIAERKFFIQKENQKIKAFIKKVGQGVDSINYKLSIKNANAPVNANTSVSILPLKAKNFNEKKDIKSAFLLTPFVKGHIENPAYYFNNANKKRKEHLDLLLLTQGWSQFGLKKMISELNPKPNFDFEIGQKLSGEVIGPLPNNMLALISSENELIDKVFLNGRKRFQFNKLLIFKGDTVKFSSLGKSGKAFKLKKIKIDSAKTRSNPIPKLPPSVFKQPEEGPIKSLEVTWDTPGMIILNEVVLAEKKRSEAYLKRERLLKKYQPLVFDIGNYQHLPLPEVHQDFNDDLMSFLNFKEGVILMNYKGVEYYLSVPANKEALLYIDGKRVMSAELSSLNLKMENIENIMLQPIKGNRIYQVFTTKNYKNNIVELFNKHIVSDGYDKGKKYYSPDYELDKYRFYDWGEIDWKPNIKTNENGSAFFKIAKDQPLNEYLFVVQGFTADGLLISEILHN